MLFVAPGYDSPDGVAIDANACWASLHSMFVQWGAADGAWMLQGAVNEGRHAETEFDRLVAAQVERRRVAHTTKIFKSETDLQIPKEVGKSATSTS
jgi:hypothetical protein